MKERVRVNEHISAARRIGGGLLVGAVLSLSAATASAADVVRIALIDPLKEAAAPFRFVIDEINAAGGVLGGKHLELVTFTPEFDVQPSVDALGQAIGQGITFVAEGPGSHVALALIKAVAQHNQAHPDQRVLYLNYAAEDPALTNDQCNFWHFRFDADVDMRMAAITTYMAAHQSQNKRVFLINQDYSYGRSVAAAADKHLQAKAPTIEIVGDELHPFRTVKDFAPYVAKIKASGADSVITGNWQDDLALLIQAADASGLDVNWYTFHAGDMIQALGKEGVGRVREVSIWHANVDSQELLDQAAAFKKKYGVDWGSAQVRPMMQMLAKAIETAGAPDALKVALALEGMRQQTPLGEVYLRKDNHQLIQPLYLSVLADDVAHPVADTGLGFKTLAKIPAEATVTETTCKMERPS
jgi:branched-chain amino acid transport system substrate-binding protein